MSRARSLALDWLLIPALMLLAGVIVYGALILPAFPFRAVAQIQGETRSYHYPTLCFISDALRAAFGALFGDRAGGFLDLLPLWNPYQDGGFPLFCDANAQLWFPATWLVALTVGYNFFVVQAQLWATFVLAGLAGFVWGRSLDLRRAPAFALGAGYMSCGAVAVSATSLSAVTGWALFPVVLAFNQRAQSGGGARPAVAGGIFLGIAALGARPGLFLVFLLNLVVYNALLFWLRGSGRPVAWRAAAWRTALLLGVCAGAGAIQWLPQVWHAGELAGGRLPYASVVNYEAPEPDELGAIISAVAAGLPIPEKIGDEEQDTGPYTPWISLTLLLAALMAWARRERTAQATALLLFFGFNLLLSLGAGAFMKPLAYNLIPGFAWFIHPATWFRGFSALALATLGGVGLDNLLALPRKRLAAWSLPAAAAIVAGIFAAGFALMTLSGWAFIRGFGRDEWRWLGGTWIGFLFAAGAGALLLLQMTGRIAPRLFAGLIAAWVVAESGTLAWRHLPLFAAPLKPDNAQTAYQLEGGREMGFPTPLALRRTAGAESAEDPNAAWLRKTPAMLSADTRKLTRYVRLLQPGDAAWMAERDYLFSVGDGTPRAAYAYQFEMAGAPDDAFDRLAAQPEGRMKNPVLEISAADGYDWGAKIQASGGGSESPQSSARLDRYTPCRAVIQTENPRAAALIFNDARFSGWQARLEESKTAMCTANGLFRAVFVPAGPHRLEFVFRPVSVWVGGGISVLSLLVSGWAAGRRRKNMLEESHAKSE